MAISEYVRSEYRKTLETSAQLASFRGCAYLVVISSVSTFADNFLSMGWKFTASFRPHVSKRSFRGFPAHHLSSDSSLRAYAASFAPTSPDTGAGLSSGSYNQGLFLLIPRGCVSGATHVSDKSTGWKLRADSAIAREGKPSV